MEPIFRFCCKRLSNRHDAEDLASEIILCVLDGIKKYKVENLDSWVWRIAHNRYARFINTKNKSAEILSDEVALFDIADRTHIEEDDDTEQRYEQVFRCLHTLSSEYRNIFVDYYIGELSVRSLAKKYSLPETTIKWRLNAGRQKIRDRIGEKKMDKIYQRINWNTCCCNGNMDSNRYLSTQLARAICLAAYEKPLTVEEISVATGIPAMYIEDELPRLEYGDAIVKIGNKYATNFILFRLKDRMQTEGVSHPLVKLLADKLVLAFGDAEGKIKEIDFYGNDFGIQRLGYVLLQVLLRNKLRMIKNERLHLENGPFPLRKDGGYGWFIVEETVDESENTSEYNAGCNTAGDGKSAIHYYWLAKYSGTSVYHNGGTRWLWEKGILQNSKNGFIEKSVLNDEDAARLIRYNLISKAENGYKFNFAMLTAKQFESLTSLFDLDDEELNGILEKWIVTVRKSFESFVPARLHDQINQWISGYIYQLIGYVTDELIIRGVLRKPCEDKPLTDGIFYIEGNIIP